MANNKYSIRYTPTFVKQFNNILSYFIQKLNNKIAAENFYNEVIQEIENRSINPEYIGNKKRKNAYYRIYVKNYTIFYVVINHTMEIRRILYSKRNFEKYI